MPRFKANIKPARYDWDAAWVLFVAGASLEEVSEACKIDYGDLIRHSAKKAWQANRKAAQTLANNNVKTNLAGRIERLRAKHQHFVLDQVEQIEEVIEQTAIGETDPDTEHLPVEKQSKMTVSKKISLTQQVHDLAAPVLGLDKQEDQVDPVTAGFAMLVAMGKGMAGHLVTDGQTKALPEPTGPEDIIEGQFTDIPQPQQDNEKKDDQAL